MACEAATIIRPGVSRVLLRSHYPPPHVRAKMTERRSASHVVRDTVSSKDEEDSSPLPPPRSSIYENKDISHFISFHCSCCGISLRGKKTQSLRSRTFLLETSLTCCKVVNGIVVMISLCAVFSYGTAAKCTAVLFPSPNKRTFNIP